MHSPQNPNDSPTPGTIEEKTGLEASSLSQPISIAQDQPPASNTLFAGGVWMIVLSAFLLLCGLCSILPYVILPFTAGTSGNAVQTNVIFGSTAGFGIILGAVLLWQGWNAARGGTSLQAAQAFPPVPALVFAFLGAVLLGIGTLAIPVVPGRALAFPPWHFVAATLPPLALLAYGAHRLGRNSGLRALVVSFSWGALAATTLAFILEMIVAVVLIVIAAVIVTRLPNSRALLDQLQAQLRLAQRTQDFSAISEWLSNPAVLAALLLYFAVIIPPLEEAVKALVVAFIDPRRTRKADAVLWGMGAGAGFAVVETVFNASVSLAAWAPLILLRVGAAVVHVANGANMGRGWYAARVERRWPQPLLAYVVSVAYHAAWNAVAISTSNTALDPTRGPVDLSGSASPAVLGLLILVVLSVLGLVWIVRMVGQARRQMVA